jgi:hypothetical protein
MTDEIPPKFFVVNRSSGDLLEIKNPKFWKFGQNGKRESLTVGDIANYSIQPYDDQGFELIIKPIPKMPGAYRVDRVRSEINENNNNDSNVVNVTNILENYPGNINEQLAALRHKYKKANAKPLNTSSAISNRHQIFLDLQFLFAFYTKLIKYYQDKIRQTKGQAALNNAEKNKRSYLIIFRNSQNAILDFNEDFKDELVELQEVAERYPSLQLSNPHVFSNPFLFRKQSLKLQKDFEKYFTLMEQYQEGSRKILGEINTRLKSTKKRRRNNNNNNSAPAPKRFTLGLPPHGGRRKTHKYRK